MMNGKEAPVTFPDQVAPARVSQVWRFPDEMLSPMPQASDIAPRWGFGEGEHHSDGAWQQGCGTGGDAAAPFSPFSPQNLK